jgi:putative addiction module component (TIGR02574 family)
MAQMTPEVSKLLEQALSLSVEEQEALADSLISNLGGKVDEAVLAAWDDEIKKRVTELDSGRVKTVPWTGVRQRNLAKLPRATRALELHEKAAAEYDAAFDWYLEAVRTRPSSSTRNSIVHWSRLRKLLSAGWAVLTMPAGSCCEGFSQDTPCNPQRESVSNQIRDAAAYFIGHRSGQERSYLRYCAAFIPRRF